MGKGTRINFLKIEITSPISNASIRRIYVIGKKPFSGFFLLKTSNFRVLSN
jgi:hypothetical protein